MNRKSFLAVLFGGLDAAIKAFKPAHPKVSTSIWTDRHFFKSVQIPDKMEGGITWPQNSFFDTAEYKERRDKIAEAHAEAIERAFLFGNSDQS